MLSGNRAAFLMLWAKTSRDRRRTHPLVCHLIDVAQVTSALWNSVLMPSLSEDIADTLNLNLDAAGSAIAFWAALHDLGKATPCFQQKHAIVKEALASLGLPFPRRFTQGAPPHGFLTAVTLQPLLEAETGLARPMARVVARAVGGHHGVWPVSGDLQRLGSRFLGDGTWAAVRRDLLHALRELLSPPPFGPCEAAVEQRLNKFVALLSGLTSVADWIGSMEEYFPYIGIPEALDTYSEQAAQQAQRALKEIGWSGWRPPSCRMSFSELFGFTPRPMQKAAIELAGVLEQPSLVIVEAPTGSGKTEAALYLADHWAHVLQQRGLYVAMPTMATSNQMFARVHRFLAHRYPEAEVTLQLVHGQAQWLDVRGLFPDTGDGDNEDERSGPNIMAWFLPRKRSLLAPFGVGTVDQAFLSVLQVRHFFVRLFGLGHKTVIFDEVHAYDSYMSTIFQRLLRWLGAMGASVVVLSATLPSQTRHELLQAYSGESDLALPEVSYPAITWVSGNQTGTVPLQVFEPATLSLEWIERDAQAIASRVNDELRDGGCAAVICNTVGRAQEVYRAIRDAQGVPLETVLLFHARYPLAWREQIEQQVLAWFGKDGKRPYRAVVVATQVIEQSLDLDFDLMISDLAPVDLIIQRAGRLHRHERLDRPPSLGKPRMLIAAPAQRDGVPCFQNDAHIYEPYVLLRSYLVLRHCTSLTVPSDTAALIDAVYGEQETDNRTLDPAMEAALAKTHQEMRRREGEHVYRARQRLVQDPLTADVLDQRSLMLEEDAPELHEALYALTRLTRPSISLVCLHQTASGLTLEPGAEGPVVNLADPPDAALTAQIARYTVNVPHSAVVKYFSQQPVPPGWRDHPLLYNHRAVVFDSGIAHLLGTAYTLVLSREMGLQIQKGGV